MTKEEVKKRIAELIEWENERKIAIVSNPFVPMPTLQDFKDHPDSSFEQLRSFVKDYDDICETIKKYEWFRSRLSILDEDYE